MYTYTGGFPPEFKKSILSEIDKRAFSPSQGHFLEVQESYLTIFSICKSTN